MVRISIITICFNSEKTIEQTIRSVIKQKTPEIEYIIIDGGSTDGTENIISRYISDIDSYVSEKDRGISDAFNKGIKKAKGEYVGIINSDDQYLPNAFKTFLSEVKEGTDVFFGNGIRVFPNGKCKKFLANPDVNALHDSMSMCHPAVFVRRGAYERYGLFSEEYKFVMDRELLLRFLNAGALFQYSSNYFSTYSMGGLSDDNYLKGVTPESYKIDLADHKPRILAMKNYARRYVVYYLLKIRDAIKGAQDNGIGFDEMMKAINEEQ